MHAALCTLSYTPTSHLGPMCPFMIRLPLRMRFWEAAREKWGPLITGESQCEADMQAFIIKGEKKHLFDTAKTRQGVPLVVTMTIG